MGYFTQACASVGAWPTAILVLAPCCVMWEVRDVASDFEEVSRREGLPLFQLIPQNHGMPQSMHLFYNLLCSCGQFFTNYAC